jgi:hypothetical protein
MNVADDRLELGRSRRVNVDPSPKLELRQASQVSETSQHLGVRHFTVEVSTMTRPSDKSLSR